MRKLMVLFLRRPTMPVLLLFDDFLEEHDSMRYLSLSMSF